MNSSLGIETSITLEQQVASHQTKRITRLTSLFLGTIGFLSIAIAILHLSRSSTEAQLRQTHTALTATHKRHAQTWRIRSTQAKRLKALKSHTLSSPQGPLLQQLAKILPPKTLLIHFSVKNNNIRLTGYSATTEELSEFMIGLSTLGLTNISLNVSQNEPSGIYFVINSCS